MLNKKAADAKYDDPNSSSSLLLVRDDATTNNNDDSDEERRWSGGGATTMLCEVHAGLFVLLLGGWLAWAVIDFVLLLENRASQQSCGQLWPFMLARASVFAVEFAHAALAALGVTEQLMLTLASSRSAEWWGASFQLAYLAGFVLAGVALVPSSVMDHAPACTDALSAASFTGTYSLATLACVHLLFDSMQCAMLAMWLVQQRQTI